MIQKGNSLDIMSEGHPETGYDRLFKGDDASDRLSRSLGELPGPRSPEEPQNGVFSPPSSPTNLKSSRPTASSPLIRRNSATSFRSFVSFTRSKKKPPQTEEYRIEYSVLQPLSSPKPIMSEKEWNLKLENLKMENDGLNLRYHMSLTEFNHLVEAIVDFVERSGKEPERIAKGSSGSYFVFNERQTATGMTDVYKAGVFKPKDEEPYGPLSPKWTKWIHRTFFPWFFGRSCLLNNQGYISEAAASYLDQRLLSFIVPYTNVVFLKSPNFYYSYLDRKLLKKKQKKYIKPKQGSLQLFLEEYQEASEWLKMHPLPENILNLPDNLEVLPTVTYPIFKWNKSSLIQFQQELEKLVILDYLIRNTDRGLDNWMIKVNWVENENNKLEPVLKIGAIDSGLAFPWKHPDEWRSFPFGWLFLPYSIIGQPFSSNTRAHYLSILTSKCWWETTVVGLKGIFDRDANFKSKYWQRQLSIIKGQAFNVIEILKIKNSTPLDLTKRERMIVNDETMIIPFTTNDSNKLSNSLHEDSFGLSPNNRTKAVVIERLEKAKTRKPIFTWC